jgi:tetratricopeptide (TPR) repeat protein
VLQLKPDFAEAHFCLGWALDLKGELDGAIAEYKSALKLNLNNAYVHYRLGADLDVKGEGDAAQQQYDQVLQIEPDFNSSGSLILKSKSKK